MLNTLRRGMTIVELLVALAILGLLAAVVYPTAAAQLRQGHASAIGNQLVNLREAIAAYQQNVGAYPASLTLLSAQPVLGDDDACGVNLSTAERGNWRGPYLNQHVAGPLPVADASIATALTRVPNNANPGFLQITATGVDNDIATDLEARFDGNANLTTGTVTWTAASGGTLVFQIPVRGC